MEKPSIIQKTFKFMGDNKNSAILVACLIAGFKGIFRPIFTMQDKQSDPKTKKYAAIREFLTEVIAIPVYIAIPSIFGKIAVNSYSKANKGAINEVAQKAIEANVKFLGVLASTAIIPAICNVIQPPIMNVIQKNGETKKTTITDNNSVPAVPTVNKPTFSGKINYGMRIGR